jgi:ubiquinone/menaquinone biosynthesis C-methylase UbiE
MVSSPKNNDSSPFASLASEYDAWFESEGKLIFAIEVNAFDDIMAQLPKPWLEVGVGSGRFAQALGIDTGIDPSAEMLEMAKKRGINAYRARGEEQSFDESTFGTVFLIITLCFVDSPLAVLREAHRILKKEGKIVLGLILRETDWGKFYQAKKQEGHPFYRQAKFGSYREITKQLKQTGFVVERVISTLFQRPNEVTKLEFPQDGYSHDAGFHVVVAGKFPTRS